MGTVTWAGCAFPDDLLYDLQHDVWVRLGDGQAEIGMTDVAQTRCGRLVEVTWKAPGRLVRRGRPLCIVESSKWVGPVLSPLSGTVAACNAEGFAADIAIANRDPYDADWLVRLDLAGPAEELATLRDGAAAYQHYRQVIDEQQIRCFRCAE